MMKKILLILISFSCLSLIVSTSTHISEFKINGKVKSFTLSELKLDSNDIKNDTIKMWKYIFNELGYLVEEIQYNGESKSTIKVKYDSQNRIIQEILFDNNNQFEEKEITEYLNFNERKIKQYNSKDSLTNVWFKFYNTNGNLIKSGYYDKSGTFISEIIFKYNNSNELTYYCFNCNEFEKNEGFITIKKKGEINEHKHCQFGTCFKDVSFIDTKKRIYKVENYSNSRTLNGTTNYEYNSFNEIYKEIVIYPNGDSLNNNYKFEYDSLKNWIKKYHYNQNKLKSIFIRNFEYYK